MSRAGSVLIFLVLLSCMVCAAETRTPLAPFVRPIDWTRFEKAPPANEQRELSGRILLNSTRWAAAWIEKAFQRSATGDRYVLSNKNQEHVIRPACSVAAGLAVALRTGLAEDHPDAVGIDAADLTARTVRLIKGTASIHKANGGGWGDHWQSSLWAAGLGRAGWMLWDDLDDDTRERVARMVEFEADRHLREDYRVPYWNGQGGDSKAEENSWESLVLLQAIAMMPGHPHARRWKAVCSELMISAFAREEDQALESPRLDGRSPKAWLRGYNLREDGLVVNHGRIHNDYMTTIASSQMAAFLLCSLAGEPVPETADFNFACVYGALVTKEFSSPPYEPPGGTMYIPGRPEQYYPQGTDWSTLRFACFYKMDTYAHVLGYERDLPHRAVDWMKLRGEKILAMQSRHANGRMYAEGEFDRYPGSEQMVLHSLSDAYLLQWLADRQALSSKADWLAEGPAVRKTSLNACGPGACYLGKRNGDNANE